MSADAERVPMWCIECRTADTAPRHHILTADGTLEVRHMDCCRTSGSCPDGSCAIVLTHSGEKRDEELQEHIVEHGEEIAQLIKERVGGHQRT